MAQQKAGGAKPVPGLAARQAAVTALQAILKDGVALDAALDPVLGGLENMQDRGLVRAIVTTSLRRRGQLERVIGRFLNKPLPAKSGNASLVLLAAAAQLVFMRVPPHAAIDLAVHQARGDRNARHFAGLVNAVLRKVAGSANEVAGEGDAGPINVPKWLWQRWADAYGAAMADEIAEAHLGEPALDVTIKDFSQASKWAGALGGDLMINGSVRIAGATGRIEKLAGYDEGAWWVQDAAASLPVKLLGDVAGQRVADLCAAPGGKTAQLCADGAKVTAVDLSQSRLERVSENLARLGLEADLVCADAAAFKRVEPFDAVLCDVPCSATGTMRRHPDLPYLKTDEQLGELVPVQAAILRQAVSMVRSGGHVVYCTCSLEPGECERQIESLLLDDATLKRMPVTGHELFGQDQLISPTGDLRTLPAHSLGEFKGMDGFYACRLMKI